jgi:hypothetical protein
MALLHSAVLIHKRQFKAFFLVSGIYIEISARFYANKLTCFSYFPTRHALLPIYGVGSARADTTAGITVATTAVVTTAAITVATTAATTVDTTAATTADITTATAAATTADLTGDQAQATSLVALRPTQAAYSLALAATALALTATSLDTAVNFPLTPVTACKYSVGGGGVFIRGRKRKDDGNRNESTDNKYTRKYFY